MKIKKNKKKTFTLVEILIATSILASVFGVIVKTIFGLNQHNIRLVENIQNLTNQMKLQTFFTENTVDNIITSYVIMGKTEMSDNDYVKDNDYQNMIDEIVFSNNGLGIKKSVNVDLGSGTTTIYLPYLIFKDKNNKLGIIGFTDDQNNKDIEALSLKIYFLNDDYYLKTRGNYTLSDLFYFYKNKSNSSLLKKYNSYIQDLKLSGRTLLDKIVFVDNNKSGNYNIYNYLTPKLLTNFIIILPSGNLELSNSTAYNFYKKSIDGLGNAKLYYGIIDIKYYKTGRIYGLNSNFLVK